MLSLLLSLVLLLLSLSWLDASAGITICDANWLNASAGLTVCDANAAAEADACCLIASAAIAGSCPPLPTAKIVSML